MLASSAEIDRLSEAQLREFTAALVQELALKQALIDRLTHEMAIIKRLRFAAKSEHFNAQQKGLFDEDGDADLEALAQQLEQLASPQTSKVQSQTPKRQTLPADLPRREVRHEPTQTVCTCGCALKRIGEDVAEKLDYAPGQFTVERHVRGKWVCNQCETLVQAPVPAHVIDKGIPTAGLLAQVLVAKYIDHLPLYRQESIVARAGFAIPRSTMAQWVGCVGVALMPLVQAMQAALLSRQVLHVDETPVSMLSPGTGKTHRAYLWSYCTTAYDPVAAVVFDFADSRAGKHAREFLGFDDERPELGWRGTLVCDDYSGYKALFPKGVTEAGCLAHARRKFFDLWANHKSVIAEEAIKLFARLYEIEAALKDLEPDERRRCRQQDAKSAAETLNRWLLGHRQKVPDGSAIALAIDYSISRWAALTRYIDTGDLPADNNRVENLIRPIALGRSNWLFAGSLRAGKRAANIMSLLHTARINGHEPHAYLKYVLERLPTHPANRIEELLPYNWQPPSLAD